MGAQTKNVSAEPLFFLLWFISTLLIHTVTPKRRITLLAPLNTRMHTNTHTHRDKIVLQRTCVEIIISLAHNLFNNICFSRLVSLGSAFSLSLPFQITSAYFTIRQQPRVNIICTSWSYSQQDESSSNSSSSCYFPQA